MVPPSTMRTKEDFELQMGTNHLGHYLLTRMLIPKLKKTAAEAQVRTGWLYWQNIYYYSYQEG